MSNYLEYSNIKKSLEKKGFIEQATHWVYGEKISAISIPIKVLKLLANNYPDFNEEIPKSLFLDRQAFKNLIDCPLSKDDYKNKYIKPRLI